MPKMCVFFIFFNMLHSGRRTTPAKGCDITLGCVVLHNIGIDRDDILDMDEVYVNHGDVNFNVRDEWDGRNVRLFINNDPINTKKFRIIS
jgi:hypothetical protein